MQLAQNLCFVFCIKNLLGIAKQESGFLFIRALCFQAILA